MAGLELVDVDKDGKISSHEFLTYVITRIGRNSP